MWGGGGFAPTTQGFGGVPHSLPTVEGVGVGEVRGTPSVPPGRGLITPCTPARGSKLKELLATC